MASSGRKIRVTYNGDEFIGIEKAGKVHVRVERTARGQNILAGIFNPKNKSWHNDNGTVPLPMFVKEQIELLYT